MLETFVSLFLLIWTQLSHTITEIYELKINKIKKNYSRKLCY